MIGRVIPSRIEVATKLKNRDKNETNNYLSYIELYLYLYFDSLHDLFINVIIVTIILISPNILYIFTIFDCINNTRAWISII